MTPKRLTHQATTLWQQRNIFVLITGVLLVITLLLSTFLFFRSERVMVVPPEIKRPLWSETSRASQAYLEEMALFIAHLVLDNSPDRAAYQRSLLMKYVASSSYGSIRRQLLEQAQLFQKNTVATSYRPLDVTVFPKKKRVVIKGKLLSYVGDKKVSETEEIFDIQFEIHHGRLFITSFSPYVKEKSHD